MRDVAEWLASISLEEYVELFADNDIDLLVVRDLTEQDLKELGVSLGHRRKILRSASELGAAGAERPRTTHQPSLPESVERRQLTVMFCDLVGSAIPCSSRDGRDGKGSALDHANIITELCQPNCQGAAGGASTNDADVHELIWSGIESHERCTNAVAAGSNQSGSCRESRRYAPKQ